MFLQRVARAEEHALLNPKNPADAANSVKTPMALFAITQLHRFGLLLVLLVLFDLLNESMIVLDGGLRDEGEASSLMEGVKAHRAVRMAPQHSSNGSKTLSHTRT